MAVMCVSWPSIIEIDVSVNGPGGEVITSDKDILTGSVVLKGGEFNGKDLAPSGTNSFILYVDQPNLPDTERVRFKVFNHTERSVTINVPERWLGTWEGTLFAIPPGHGVEILRVVWKDQNDEPVIRWIMRGTYYEYSNM